MNIKLLPATENDIDLIADIEKRVANRLFHSFTKVEEFENYLKNSKVFFITLDGEKIGTISYEPKEDCYEFDGLTVLPEYRGKGIAREALNQMLKKTGSDKPIILYVHPENSPAIINYLKVGFVIKGWHDNRFNDNEPRLMLRRDSDK